MTGQSASALVTDQGRRVHLRIRGRLYDLSHEELRTRLGLCTAAPGLGITIDGDRFHFAFAPDNQIVELSAEQLRRRIAKQLVDDR